MQAGISLSGPNTREVEFAEYISRRIPSMEQVRFCNSGSEACLFATLLARHATKRRKILVFNLCYHGGFMIYGPSDPALSVPFETVKADYNDIAGTRAVAIVRKDDGRFEPREIQLGADFGETLEVTAGLSEGEQVVASGQFLVDSEARLRSVLANMAAPRAASQASQTSGEGAR